MINCTNKQTPLSGSKSKIQQYEGERNLLYKELKYVLYIISLYLCNSGTDIKVRRNNTEESVLVL